jgi:hypothetical protein
MTDRNFKSLDEQLAELSREVVPPRNLWHGIVVGIARKPRFIQPMAFAAAAACILLGSALAWVMLREPPDSARVRSAMVRAVNFDDPTDSRYAATRTALETTFHARLALLDPKTRTQIESSLAAIRQAHEDIHRALAAEPANPLLEQLLESTLHDEFDLYDHVVRATQPALTRT